MPAASSSTRRRCSGLAWMISPMLPWWTSAGERDAGGCIGEQDLHVAGAHVAAVDPVDRAGLALDPARDFERLVDR